MGKGLVKNNSGTFGVCGTGFPACHCGAGADSQVGRLENLPHIQLSKMDHLFLDRSKGGKVHGGARSILPVASSPLPLAPSYPACCVGFRRR